MDRYKRQEAWNARTNNTEILQKQWMESFPHNGITDLNKALRGSSIHFMVFGNEHWFIKQSIKNFIFLWVFRSISHQFSRDISLRRSSRRFLLTYLFSKHTCSRSAWRQAFFSLCFRKCKLFICSLDYFHYIFKFICSFPLFVVFLFVHFRLLF